VQGLTSGQFAGIAPIPVPGFAGPQDIPRIPGVNTIPGLDMWNYVVGQLVPQSIPAANQLLGSSISRLMPQTQTGTKTLASDIFKAVQPHSADVDVDRMMGRWFQVGVIETGDPIKHHYPVAGDQQSVFNPRGMLCDSL
jgi:hypothetical protein